MPLQEKKTRTGKEENPCATETALACWESEEAILFCMLQEREGSIPQRFGTQQGAARSSCFQDRDMEAVCSRWSLWFTAVQWESGDYSIWDNVIL